MVTTIAELLEIDFLESVWTVNAGTPYDYRRLYATQWNQVSRSFIDDMGSTGHADGGKSLPTITSLVQSQQEAASRPESYVGRRLVLHRS